MSGVALLGVSTWHPSFITAIKEHYTGSDGPPPGKKLAWRVLSCGRHVGWIGVGEPAYKLAARRRLGLEDARPRPHTVSCFIYRRETDAPVRGADVIAAFHISAAEAWERRYGQPIVHWETMVDPREVESEVPGACFRRSGYRSLGMTTGRGARRPPGSTRGPRVWGPSSPKLVLYRGPLHRLPACPGKD